MYDPNSSVTENGFAVKGENDMPIEEAIMDNDRVHYFQGTTAALLNAIHEDGVQIRSYFPWSALNSFPFASPILTAPPRFPRQLRVG